MDWGATKQNSLSIEGYELMAPTAGFSAYMGGVKVSPDISKILAKTNVPASSFSVFVQGGVGVAPIANTSRVAWFAGGGAKYMITPSLSWSTVDARLGQVGGTSFVQVSTGISYLFNPQNSNNAAVKAAYTRKLKTAFLKLSAAQQK
jgi:hypothetical protein